MIIVNEMHHACGKLERTSAIVEWSRVWYPSKVPPTRKIQLPEIFRIKCARRVRRKLLFLIDTHRYYFPLNFFYLLFFITSLFLYEKKRYNLQQWHYNVFFSIWLVIFFPFLRCNHISSSYLFWQNSLS